MFADSHIHLTHSSFDGEVLCITSSEESDSIIHFNRAQLISELKENNIAFCVEPCIELDSNIKILEFAEKNSGFIYPAVGVYPTRTPQTKWKRRKELYKFSEKEGVVAIGELGLDYHYERMKQHRFKQMMWFIWQLKLADKRQLPIILHIRLADDDAIKALRHFRKRLHGGVYHCFNSGIGVAKIYTEEFGIMLGIGGSLLQENCSDLEETVRNIPLEFLLLETDGPYVKPAKPEGISNKQWKKAKNTSLIIPDIAKRVAEIKGIDVAKVEEVTTENAKRLLGIKQ